jgi:hypothetical protein
MSIKINDLVNSGVLNGTNTGITGRISRGRNSHPMPKPMILVISFLFLAVGVFLIVRTIYNNRVLTAETTAVVTDVREEINTSRSTHSDKAVIEINTKEPKTTKYYYPTIEYRVNGQTYNNELSTGSSNPDEYAVGTSLSIRYNPDKPTEIDLGSASNKTGIIGALACIAASVIAGIVFLRS